MPAIDLSKYGVPVVFTRQASGGDSTMPNTITAYISQIPLQNGKFKRTYYIPSLNDGAACLTSAIATYYTPPAANLAPFNMLPGNQMIGPVVPILKNGSYKAGVNAWIGSDGNINFINIAETSSFSPFQLTNIFEK